LGFFTQVKESFLNYEAYREFAFQKRGKTFKYFFVLFTLVFIIGGIRFIGDFKNGTSDIIATVKEDVPEFRLENGELTVEGQQPIIMGEGDSAVLVIDTTGQTDDSILDRYIDGVFISKEKIVVKENPQLRIIKFSDLKDLTFDKQKLLDLLPMLKWLFVGIAFFAYLFSITWALITTVILALIGLFINSMMKGRLVYNNLWNIAVYAFTFPWLLEMVKNLVYPGLSYFWVIKWSLAGYILYKGIEAANKPVTTGEPPQPPEDMVI